METQITTSVIAVRYATFALALVGASAVIGYQWYARNQLAYYDRPQNISYFILPIYNTVLILDILVCIVGFILTAFSNDLATYHIFVLVYMFYSGIPLILLHLHSFPKNTMDMLKIIGIIAAIVTVFVVLDTVLPDSSVEFYVFASITGSVILTFLGLLFRKRTRTYKQPSVIIHTLLVNIFLGLTIAINYYRTFRPGDSAFNTLFFTRSTVWIFSAATSIVLMFRDTRYWRGLTDTRSLIENMVDEPVVVQDLSNDFANLARRYESIFIDFATVALVRRIATGGRSEVYMGVHKGKKVALKVYKPREITREIIQQWSKEVGFSVMLEHPNVIKCYGIVIAPPRVAVVFEHCRRNLIEYLVGIRVSLLMGVLLMLDITSGLMFLHEKGIIHRDIKLENILICKCHGGICAKLIDFGESRYTTQQSMTIIGTPQYLAPEVLVINMNDDRAFYNQKADIFSLGFVFWEILHNGKSPYPEKWSIAAILTAKKNGYRPTFDENVEELAPELVKLIKNMWNEDATARPAIETIHRKVLAFGKSKTRQILEQNLSYEDTGIITYLEENNFAYRRTESVRLLSFIRKYTLVSIAEEEKSQSSRSSPSSIYMDTKDNI